MEISKNIDLEAAARKQQETNVDKHLMDEVGLLRDLCDQVGWPWLGSPKTNENLGKTMDFQENQ